jgi:hypothetical protein
MDVHWRTIPGTTPKDLVLTARVEGRGEPHLAAGTLTAYSGAGAYVCGQRICDNPAYTMTVVPVDHPKYVGHCVATLRAVFTPVTAKPWPHPVTSHMLDADQNCILTGATDPRSHVDTSYRGA